MSHPDTVADQLGHPRATFDMYGRHLAIADWAYEVDDFGHRYGPGLWPYRRPLETWDRDAQTYQRWEGAVRLAPALEYRAWSNNYVSVYPLAEVDEDPEQITRARMHLRLSLGNQGMGAYVVTCTVDLDLAASTWTVRDGDIAGELRVEADTKAARVLALLAAERVRRDTRPAPLTPLTAHARWARTSRIGTR